MILENNYFGARVNLLFHVRIEIRQAIWKNAGEREPGSKVEVMRLCII